MSASFQARFSTSFSAIVFATLLIAQTDNGTIRGTVQDSSGASVGGANVTATNVATGIQLKTVSAEAGNYNIPQVRPGMYTVEVEHPGFKKLIARTSGLRSRE